MAETWPYVKQTWTENVSSGSAARFTYMEEGIRAAHLQPVVRVTHTLNQTITTATDTALAFNTERFDSAAGIADTMHDNATNNSRLTCRYAGIYQITAIVNWTFNASGFRYLAIRLNGSTLIARDGREGNATTAQSVSALYALAVNDYVEAVVTQDSGTSRTVEQNSNYSPEFMMVRVA
jgi:hypothetical protein